MNGRGNIVLPPITAEVTPENFSYSKVATNKVLEVPVNQQMLVFQELVIEGEIEADGEIVITTPVNLGE
jgi:hypothetical protein